MYFIDGVNYVSDVMALPDVLILIGLTVSALSIAAFAFLGRFCFLEKMYDKCVSNKYKKVAKTLLPIPLAIWFCTIAALLITHFFDPLSLKISTGEYMVSISSDVDMKEFIDTYEIIEYDDNDRTFTIKIRE